MRQLAGNWALATTVGGLLLACGTSPEATARVTVLPDGTQLFDAERVVTPL
jgi:hypothetical protein